MYQHTIIGHLNIIGNQTFILFTLRKWKKYGIEQWKNMRIQKLRLEKHKKASRDFIIIEIWILNESGKSGLPLEKWLTHEGNYRKSIMFGIKAGIDTIQYIS